MAISARTAALLEQRRSSGGYSSNRIRVLSPSKTSGINSIAKRAVQDQLSAMITQYNDGLIGNEEMLSFLQKNANNPGLTVQDKAELNSQISDFTVRIRKGQLEAVYKNAPDGSLQQIQAAEALTNFYNDRASKMEPGTPAQSQALENAGIWNQRISDLKLKGARADQKNLEAQFRQNINTLPTSSSQRSKAEADMYQKLYDLAISQGDQQSADQYAAAYNQAATVANQYTQSEAEQEKKLVAQQSKKDLNDTINLLKNQWHDGTIDEKTFLEELAKIEPRIDELGDTNLVLKFNQTTDEIAKALEKGGLRRKDVGGLPAVVGKGPNGQDETNWDREDMDYTNDLEVAKSLLTSDATNPQEAYLGALNVAISTRQQQITDRLATVEALAQENPNQKIYYDGSKRRAVDVLESLRKEEESISEQASALQGGRAVLVEVPPKQFNKSGGVSNGKSVATYEVKDANNLPKDEFGGDLYQPDTQGVYHLISRGKTEISKEDYQLGEATDPASYGFDSATGRYYKLSDPVVTVYKPGTSEKVDMPYVKDQPVQTYEEFKNPKPNVEQLKTDAVDILSKTTFPEAKGPNLNLGDQGIETPQVRAENVQNAQQDAVINSLKLEDQAKARVAAGEKPMEFSKVELPQINITPFKPASSTIGASGVPTIAPVAPKITNVGEQIKTNQVKPVVSGLYINPSGELAQGGKTVPVNIGTNIQPTVTKAPSQLSLASQPAKPTTFTGPIDISKLNLPSNTAQKPQDNWLTNTISGGVNWLKKKLFG